MALIDRLSAPPTPPPNRSRLDDWVQTLPPVEQQAVWDAVKNRAWNHRALMAALVAEGCPEVADNTFGSWRRKHGYV